MTQKVDTWFDDTVMLACDTVSAELLEKNFEAQFLRADTHRSNEKEKDLALASPLLVCIGPAARSADELAAGLWLQDMMMQPAPRGVGCAQSAGSLHSRSVAAPI
jgi:hypothetical protein